MTEGPRGISLMWLIPPAAALGVVLVLEVAERVNKAASIILAVAILGIVFWRLLVIARRKK